MCSCFLKFIYYWSIDNKFPANSILGHDKGKSNSAILLIHVRLPTLDLGPILKNKIMNYRNGIQADHQKEHPSIVCERKQSTALLINWELMCTSDFSHCFDHISDKSHGDKGSFWVSIENSMHHCKEVTIGTAQSMMQTREQGKRMLQFDWCSLSLFIQSWTPVYGIYDPCWPF